MQSPTLVYFRYLSQLGTYVSYLRQLDAFVSLYVSYVLLSVPMPAI